MRINAKTLGMALGMIAGTAGAADYYVYHPENIPGGGITGTAAAPGT